MQISRNTKTDKTFEVCLSNDNSDVNAITAS